ncbi:MAG TPA: PA0069 family radical SAM protein [Candidatus Paceibacterota bacterium]|nr:PA0069 family radical SAM protein [Verrucomicrobiota bacterium]HSA10470.1 PA0069 family radical SAM protein [Candidatus Paceibacterota bacterium]
MKPSRPSPPARGAGRNPPNRFERLTLERDADWDPEQDPLPRTQFLRDRSRSIISHNDSPDIGFEASLNPYRGCEHGCIYCFARPTHEYLGFSAGLDFETKIMVKDDAPRLLRNELSAPGWVPKVISLSGVTDPYQPVERRLKLTRRCLEVLAQFRNPVTVVTKNSLVARDLDLLAELAGCQAVVVYISLTTLDTELRKILEPRTSPPAARLATIGALAKAGVPVGVLVAPVIPGLTDHEIPAVIAAAAKAGAKFAAHSALRLPLAVAPLFEEWLARHLPEKKDKILHRVRAMRRGKLNNPEFGLRMRGEGIFADQISDLFHVACRKVGWTGEGPELSTAGFRRPGAAQLPLALPGSDTPLPGVRATGSCGTARTGANQS